MSMSHGAMLCVLADLTRASRLGHRHGLLEAAGSSGARCCRRRCHRSSRSAAWQQLTAEQRRLGSRAAEALLCCYNRASIYRSGSRVYKDACVANSAVQFVLKTFLSSESAVLLKAWPKHIKDGPNKPQHRRSVWKRTKPPLHGLAKTSGWHLPSRGVRLVCAHAPMNTCRILRYLRYLICARRQ